MNDMFRMGTFLFVISAVAGVLLGFTEMKTAPRILENRLKQLEQARAEVLPQAKIFNDIKSENANEGLLYTAGFAENGELAGIVVNVAPKGYAGPIEMVLGLKADGSIAGVKILSQKETPGLGTKLADDVFLAPFKKLLQDKPKPKFKVKQDGGDVDGITAATISSRAFCAGVSEAIGTFEKVREQLPDLKAPAALPAVPQAGDAK